LAAIVPVPKKGDLSKVENYRPIALLETTRKLFEMLLLQQLKTTIKSLSPAQGGFRENRGTLDQVANLQDLIKLHHSRSGNFPIVAFLDIKAAYDSVDRSILFSKCIRQGIDPALTEVLRQLYDFNLAFVSINGLNSSTAALKAGVQQGSLISPLLYSIFIDDIVSHLEKGPGLKSPFIGIKNFNVLMYADDIAVVASTAEEMNRLLTMCLEHSNNNNYRFSPKKCVFLSKMKPPKPIMMGNNELERVANFCYLGIYFNFKGFDKNAQIQATKAKALKTEKFFKRIGMNSGGWHLASKIAVYKSFIRSKLEYGLAILEYTKKQVDEIDKVQREALCDMLGVPRNSSASTLRVLTGLVTLEQRQNILRAKFISKCIENENDTSRLLPKVTQWMRRANLTPLIDELTKANKIHLTRSPEENSRILRQLQDQHMKDAISQTKIFQSELLESTKWKDLSSLMTNWNIDKNAVRNIVLFLVHKIPGKPQPCINCNELTSKEHIVKCNKNVWINLLNELLKIKCLRKHLRTLVEGCSAWLNLPSYIINLACVVKKRTVQAKISNELSEALVKCIKNCCRATANPDPP
jgi:hypothetical protein